MKLYLGLIVLLCTLWGSQANEEFDMLATATGTGATDNGYTANIVNECVDLSSVCIPGTSQCIGNLCLTFQLDTCAQMVNINFTRNDNVVFAQQISNLETQEQCQDGSPCRTCLGFSRVSITPAGATLCPQVTVRCPLNINPKTNFQCINVGTECKDASSCEDCTQQSNCGWCESQKQCRPVGRTGPYCSTCFPSESWYTTCPSRSQPLADGDTAASSSLSSGAVAGVVIGVVLGVALLVGLIAYVVTLKRRIKRATDQRGDVVRLESDMEASQSQSQSETNETYVPPK